MFLQYPGEIDHPANIRLRENGARIMGFPSSDHIEATQILRYQAGQYYHAHPDYFSPNDHNNLDRGGQRIASLITWLNDVPEGGETWFPLQDLKVKPKRGMAVVFPVGFTHPHEVLATKSRRYILQTWITDPDLLVFHRDEMD